MPLKGVSDLLEAYPWLAPIILPLVALVGGVVAWQKFSGGRLRLSLQRTKRLREKMKAKPIGLQLDAAIAFGVEVDNRVIEMAMEREDPLGLIRWYIRSRQYILPKDGAFVSRPNLAGKSFKAQSNIALGIVVVYFFILWIGLIFVFRLPYWPQVIVIGMLIAFPVIGPMLAWFSAKLATAHRLTAELDVYHPIRKKPARQSRSKAMKALPKDE